MFTASRCLSCPCYLELIAFSKSVCSFCFARENTCVRLIVSVHIFLHLFTIFGAFQCVNVQEMLLCAVVCMHLYAAHCFWRVTGSRLVLGLISHSCIWCKWPNPLDFPFKLSGHISRLNDRSTSWQSLWEAESAIKSERRLKGEQLQPKQSLVRTRKASVAPSDAPFSPFLYKMSANAVWAGASSVYGCALVPSVMCLYNIPHIPR